MSFFRRKKQPETSLLDKANEAAKEAEKIIAADREERAQVVAENIEQADRANGILKRNGFTLTLYLAAHNPAVKKG